MARSKVARSVEVDVDGRRLFQMKRTIRLFINPGVETQSCLARKKLCRVLYHPAPFYIP